MNNNPLVSVCIPTYNNARFLRKSLESIINQTYENIEIIISDNASTDNTQDIVRSISDKRIRYYRQPVNVSFIENWNESIQLANAEYRALYHSDDIYMPEIVKKEVNFLMKHPDVGVVSTLGRFIDENNRIVSWGIKMPAELMKKDTYNFIELFNILMKRSGSFMFFPTFMAKREVFNKVGYFQEFGKHGSHIYGASDMDIFLRISQHYKIGIIKERLVNRGISSSHLTGQYITQRASRSVHFIALDDFLNEPMVYNNIDKCILEQYQFNKFWDDVLIAINLVNKGKQNDAKNLLKNTFCKKYIIVGLKNGKNIVKLMIWLILIASATFGSDKICQKVSISIFRFLQKYIWNN